MGQHTVTVEHPLNVKNLFDKTYYTGLGNFGTGFYGEPRSLQLATKWDF